MNKKALLFAFTLVASLSASLASALPPPCYRECFFEYRSCIRAGTDPAICQAESERCTTACYEGGQ